MCLSSSYEAERKKLSEEVKTCEQGIREYNENVRSADRFIRLIDKYANFEELTNPMLLELVDKILVHERDIKGSSRCTQTIEIYFNFVGRYLPPEFAKEPTAEDLAEMEAERLRHEKRHQAYLRRKESGKARAYYEARIKEARKAEIESMKAEIRKEDQENGVFYVVADCPEGQPTIVHPGEEYDGRKVLLPTGTEGRI